MDYRHASDLIKDQRSSWCWWHQKENTRLFLLLSQSGKRCRFFIAQETWHLASGTIRNLGTLLRAASSQEFHGKTNKVSNSCFLSHRWLCAIRQVFNHRRPRSRGTAETPQVCIWAHPTLLSPPVLFRVESEEMSVSRLETSRGMFVPPRVSQAFKQGIKRGIPARSPESHF